VPAIALLRIPKKIEQILLPEPRLVQTLGLPLTVGFTDYLLVIVKPLLKEQINVFTTELCRPLVRRQDPNMPRHPKALEV
jgi:hypothetical protein